jgi:hypothetical protein
VTEELIVRIQTKQQCEEQDRRYRLVRQDLRNVNAEKAGMALELTKARQWGDWWRARALKAEAVNRALHAENVRLLARLAEEKEESDCDG